MNKLKVFSGNPGRPLAEKVCEQLSLPLGQATVGRFSDGEVKIEILEDVRGNDVFIINPTNPPAENLLELILLTDAISGSSARRTTIAPTYLGYNRQERKDKPRVPISAQVIISTLSRTGCHRALLFDLHAEATVGIFRTHGIIVDHLYASIAGVEYLKPLLEDNFVVASPDAGGVNRARAYAKRLKLGLVVFYKEKDAAGRITEEETIIIGEVAGKNILFVDDMIDTAETIVTDARAAKRAGANRIVVFATHAVFSQGAILKLDQSEIDEVVITDSIYHSPEELKTKRVKVTVVSIAPLAAQAIRRIHEEESLKTLFL